MGVNTLCVCLPITFSCTYPLAIVCLFISVYLEAFWGIKFLYARSGAAAATLERLEAAAKAKEEADRAAKLAQGQRRAHTAGRLTAEEKVSRTLPQVHNCCNFVC